MRKFVPENYREDIKHDLFLVLFKNAETVVLAEEKNQTAFYCARIIINMATQRNQLLRRFYMDERNESFEEKMSVTHNDVEREIDNEVMLFGSSTIDDGSDIERLKDIEEKENEVSSKLIESEHLFNTPYYRLLGEALMINGTAGKVSKATGIPKSSVQQGIKKLRGYLNV